MYNNVDFAAELKEIREMKGIGLKEMANKLKTSTSQIHRIESGQNITVSVLAEYLEQIGLDILDIFKE
jgi:transcriptional regulator with XRE-family HTH domain